MNKCCIVSRNRKISYIQQKEGRLTGFVTSWRRICLLKRVIEGKLEGRIEVTGRRGRKRKQLLDDIEERREHCNLEKETLACILW